MKPKIINSQQLLMLGAGIKIACAVVLGILASLNWEDKDTAFYMNLVFAIVIFSLATFEVITYFKNDREIKRLEAAMCFLNSLVFQKFFNRLHFETGQIDIGVELRKTLDFYLEQHRIKLKEKDILKTHSEVIETINSMTMNIAKARNNSAVVIDVAEIEGERILNERM